MTNVSEGQEAAKKIQVFRSASDIFIKKRWVNQKSFGIALFTLFWDYTVWLLLNWLFATNHLNGLVVSFWLLGFLSLTFFINYVTTTMFFNQTYIWTNGEKILVLYQPLPCPWLSNQEHSVAQIERLYSRRKVHYYGWHFTDEVRLQTKTGKDKKLVVLDTPQEALFVERTLENYLQLADQPQVGEFGGSYEEICPNTIEIYQHNGNLTIVYRTLWRWLQVMPIWFTVFALLLGRYAIAQFGNVLSAESILLQLLHTIWFLLIFLIDLLLVYFSIILWFNNIHIAVNPHKISVYSHPIPRVKNTHISATQLQKICYQKESFSSNRETEEQDKNSYRVYGRTYEGKEEDVIRLDREREAVAVKTILSDYLGIPDTPQEGNINKFPAT